jgi:hypothetical protein
MDKVVTLQMADTTFRFDGFRRRDIGRFQQAIEQLKIAATPLEIQRHHDVELQVPVPLGDGRFKGGAFLRASGAPIALAQVHRADKRDVFGTEPNPSTGEIKTYPAALYGGILFGGFGHVILESACRLWAASRHPDLPILIQGPAHARKLLLQLAEILGIDGSRFDFLQTAAHVHELFVPAPGIELGLTLSRETRPREFLVIDSAVEPKTW